MYFLNESATQRLAIRRFARRTFPRWTSFSDEHATLQRYHSSCPTPRKTEGLTMTDQVSFTLERRRLRHKSGAALPLLAAPGRFGFDAWSSD